MNFPNYSNIQPEVQSSIKKKVSDTVYRNSLMPWIRISSAYNNGLILSSNLKGDSFSSRYGDVNQPGAIGLDFNGNIVKEITDDSTARGLRPSPIIDSLNVTNGARGLSRKATFKIKCFSLGQAERLAQHFLEPRFFALVEFGWNVNESYQQLATLNGSEAVCNMIDYQNLAVLKDKRTKSNGNYDAFLGVITGGGISYGDDESHILDVEITTAGEIPAFLQHHRGSIVIDSSGETDSSNLFGKQKIDDESDNKESLGRSLFMQMYNDLPSAKQIQDIKKLAYDAYWATPDNFINMDSESKKIISDTFSKKVNVKTEDTRKVKLPTDASWVSPHRFIRMELAWKILNTTSTKIINANTGCSNSVTGASHEKFNTKIDISNTICKAHRYMFSTDASKLYIPNPELPNFGLSKVLSQKEENVDINNKQKWISPNNFETIDGSIGGFKFPEQTECLIENESYDESVCNITQDAKYWGKLENLYLNFDFFVSCLNKNGFYAKDVALDILNGISGAVNLYWNFQITDKAKLYPIDNKTGKQNKDIKIPEGQVELQVVDWSFTGKVPTITTPFARYQTRGMKSPFISFDMKLEVAGAIANQVMLQRISQQKGIYESGASNEQEIQDFKYLFANGTDPISDKLNEIEVNVRELTKSEVNEENKTEEISKNKGTVIKAPIFNTFGVNIGVPVTINEDDVQKVQDTKKKREIIENNIDLFIKNAGMFPVTKTRKEVREIIIGWLAKLLGNTPIPIDEWLWVGTWKDSKLLREFELASYKNESGDDVNEKVSKKTQGLLPIEANFTIHGISGLKVGDMLGYDDLPRKYRRNVFQIFEINHSISDSGWTTSVVTKMRNLNRKDIEEIVE